jgi:hypothetical protein
MVKNGQKIFLYSRGSEFATVPCPYRIVPCPYRFPFFMRSQSQIVTVPFFSQTFCFLVKRTEPLILTVRFLVFDREPYRTKTGTVRIAVRFGVLNNKRIMVSILVRYGSRSNTKKRTVKINGSVRFALPNV